MGQYAVGEGEGSKRERFVLVAQQFDQPAGSTLAAHPLLATHLLYGNYELCQRHSDFQLNLLCKNELPRDHRVVAFTHQSHSESSKTTRSMVNYDCYKRIGVSVATAVSTPKK